MAFLTRPNSFLERGEFMVKSQVHPKFSGKFQLNCRLKYINTFHFFGVRYLRPSDCVDEHEDLIIWTPSQRGRWFDSNIMIN